MDLDKILERFGFPAFLVCVCVIATWRVVSWFGKEIVKPTMDNFNLFINTVSANNSKFEDTINTQAHSLQTQSSILQKLLILQQQQNEMLEAIHVKLHEPRPPGA